MAPFSKKKPMVLSPLVSLLFIHLLSWFYFMSFGLSPLSNRNRFYLLSVCFWWYSHVTDCRT